jgi:hypothetical protein
LIIPHTLIHNIIDITQSNNPRTITIQEIATILTIQSSIDVIFIIKQRADGSYQEIAVMSPLSDSFVSFLSSFTLPHDAMMMMLIIVC